VGLVGDRPVAGVGQAVEAEALDQRKQGPARSRESLGCWRKEEEKRSRAVPRISTNAVGKGEQGPA
jgi:hypothetical protein